MKIKRCLVCKTPFQVKPRGRPKLFCSNLCKMRDKRARAAGTSRRKPNHYHRST